MNKKFLTKIVQAILAIPATYLIIEYSTWQIAVGIFLLLWANNIDYKKED